MLLWFVIIYWLISVAIGLYAARRVHNTKDFAVAGRHLPFYMTTCAAAITPPHKRIMPTKSIIAAKTQRWQFETTR